MKKIGIRAILCSVFVLISGGVIAQEKVVAETSMQAGEERKANIIIDDFEEMNGRLTASTGRECILGLTSNEFVISGKYAVKFNVNAPELRPYFSFSFSATNWDDYGSLKFYVFVLPTAFASHSEMGITLTSTDWDRKSWKQGDKLWNYRFDVPTGKPVVVSVPIDELRFKDKVGEAMIFTTSVRGTYFVDKVELSAQKTKDVTIETFSPSEKVFVPDEWFYISLIQEGGFYHDGIFCYNSDKPLSLSLELNKPVREKEEKEVKLSDEKGNKLFDTKIIFEKGEGKKEISLSPRGKILLKIDHQEAIFKFRDIKGIAEENIKIREERRKTGNPFFRGIVSPYYWPVRKKDNSPDIDATIARLKDLGVNCYTYLIGWYPEKELACLPDFCKKAAEEGIEVWAYLLPPSEYNLVREKKNGQKYPPFDDDYLKWAEALAQISLQCPNFTLWMIDDFNYNSNYTIDYTRQIYETSKKVNSKLLIGFCVYYSKIKKYADAGYLSFADAILWGYQFGSEPDRGISVKSLPLEINDYYKICSSRLIIPCIYLRPCSTWPKDRPTKEYLEEAAKIAYEQAGVCFLNTLPDPETWKYDVVGNYVNSIELEQWSERSPMKRFIRLFQGWK